MNPPQKEGFVMVFTALIMPVILILGAVMVDSGFLIIRHAELSYISRESGNSALYLFSKSLTEEAQQSKFDLCDEEETPDPVCDSDKISDFMSWSEIENFAHKNESLILVQNEMIEFSNSFGSGDPIEQNQYQIEPLVIDSSQNKISLTYTIRETPELWFSSILTPSEIAITHKSKIFIP